MDHKVILLADDDSDDTEMFCEALADIDPGIICHCAINGRELLKMLNELSEKPQLIFLDLNMPIMNGWQCLKLLKEDERYKHIPVIMISTSSHQLEMDMAANLGALCYFVKPNSFNVLTQVLKAIAENLGAGLKDALLDLQAGGSRHIHTCNDIRA